MILRLEFVNWDGDTTAHIGDYLSVTAAFEAVPVRDITDITWTYWAKDINLDTPFTYWASHPYTMFKEPVEHEGCQGTWIIFIVEE